MWAAQACGLLPSFRSAMNTMETSPAPFAAAALLTTARSAAGLPTAAGPIPAGELQRRLSAAGLSLHVRVEPYDDHDDLLHLAAEADPDRHRLLISRTEQAIAAATAS